MTKKKFQDLIEDILTCPNEVELIKISDKINSIKTIDHRDHAILQLFLSTKVNEMSILNLLDVINEITVGMHVDIEAPPYNERH